MIYDIFKRLMDIVLSIILMIFFLPIIIITAIIVKLTSNGPVFADTPKRIGKNGKPFYPYKFRSMIANAHELIRSDPKLRKIYQEFKKSNYKLKQDPRVTPFGRIIRKYSIDEIPQLVNVLRGEMSLVGPRPYYPDELQDQQKNYPETKNLIPIVLTAKPGITGLWQVSGRSEINFDKRIKLDTYYVKNKSLLLDLKILTKTPWAMISGKGAI